MHSVENNKRRNEVFKSIYNSNYKKKIKKKKITKQHQTNNKNKNRKNLNLTCPVTFLCASLPPYCNAMRSPNVSHILVIKIATLLLGFKMSSDRETRRQLDV